MAVDYGAMKQKFFQGRRDDIERNANAQGQQVGDALTRRFAAIGQSGSGAAMAAQLKGQEQVQGQANQARNELAGAEVQSMEPDIQRQFQEKLTMGDQAFKKGMFDVEQGNKLKELDLAERNFALDKDTTEFNKRMAEIEANREAPGLFGSLMPGMSNKKMGGALGGLHGAGLGMALGPVGGVAGAITGAKIGGGK